MTLQHSAQKPRQQRPAGLVIDNLISLRSQLSLSSVAVAEQADGTGDEQGER
jgi:hypothetical protein